MQIFCCPCGRSPAQAELLRYFNMSVRDQRHYEAQDASIKVDFITDRGQYHASHYAQGLEMIFLLNGNAGIMFDGRPVNLVQGEFAVIDTGHVYELSCREQFMEVRVHVDGDFFARRAALEMADGQTGWTCRCLREDLTHEKLGPFLEICDLFKELVPLYINEPAGYRLKTESIVLEILFLLVTHFTYPVFGNDTSGAGENRQRIREILHYIEEHYAEDVSLERIAGDFGLTREYFSRLFHKTLGLTFSQHLIRVRIAHFYHDLVSTDEPVMELLEKHALTNYRLFSRTFKEIYGYTPREIRKMG